MAIQDKAGRISGKAGSIIYRQWRGLNIIQGLPKKGKQTLASRAAAAEFGRASATAASIRKALHGFYLQSDLGMNNRLTKQVLKALQNAPEKKRLERDIHDADLSQLQGFQFNQDCPLHEALPVIPEVQMKQNGAMRVHIPAFKRDDIRYTGEHRGALFFRIRLVAFIFDFRKGFGEVLEVKDFSVDEAQHAIDWELKSVIPSGMIAMLGLTLLAEGSVRGETLIYNSPSWSPAALIGICHVSEGDKQTLEAIEFLEKNIADGKNSFIGLQHPCCMPYDKSLRLAYSEFLSKQKKPKEQISSIPIIQKGRIILSELT